MTRKCPIDNCLNTCPSAGKKPNGEQKYRARCRKHQKEWGQFPAHATGKTMVMPADMKEVKKETIVVTMTKRQFNFFFIFCLMGLLAILFLVVGIMDSFIR